MMDLSDRNFKAAVVVLLIALIAAVVVLALLTGDEPRDKVAYVNLERVFAEHPARRVAEEKLNQKAAQYQQQLEEQAAELSGREQKKLLAAYQDQLQNLEAELLDSVLKEIELLITETAAENEVKFVLEKEKVLYGGYNLTDQLLAKLEAEWQP